MPLATSSSAMPFTSSGCRPQNSAICSKVSEVLSTSHTAVALGMSGFCSAAAMAKKSFLSPGGDPRASVPSLDRSNVEEEGGFSAEENVWLGLFRPAFSQQGLGAGEVPVGLLVIVWRIVRAPFLERGSIGGDGFFEADRVVLSLAE